MQLVEKRVSQKQKTEPGGGGPKSSKLISISEAMVEVSSSTNGPSQTDTQGLTEEPSDELTERVASCGTRLENSLEYADKPSKES
jgi:hypothetical protein